MNDQPANGAEPAPPSYAPLVPPIPMPKRTGASVIRLPTGEGMVLLQVHNAGGMAFGWLTPAEAMGLAESLARNANAAELSTPPKGLHLPE
jgi:hypothetical protein